MRYPIALALALVVVLTGCGAGPGTDQDERQALQDEEDSTAAGVISGMMGGLNTEVHVDPAIAGAWSGIRVQVVDATSGDVLVVDARLGERVDLGASGLTLVADLFIPDFLMDEGGIRSRSPETYNPAARVVISEEGMADYRGWLFAAMPEIHPYPHDRYQVLLVEGIPAG